MSRKLLVGLAVIVVAILAWITIARMDDGTEVADAPVEAPATETADTDATVVETETDAGEAVEDAADATAETAEDAADATGDAIDDAADATADAAGDAADATADAADDAADATADAADDAADATAETDVPTDAELATLLTEDGFEAEPLVAYVEASDLTDAEKADLTARIEAAQDDETLVPALVADMRTEFDVE